MLIKAMELASLASTLKSLHIPGKPVVFANVYDALSAEAVAAVPSCNALATASYAVACAAGLADDDLTLETNITAAQAIGKVALKYNKPLSVDIQDGYGKRLEEAVIKAIEAGAVGVNLEDYDRERNGLISADEAVERIHTVISTARAKNVPDFVVNARCDILLHGGSLEDTIARGKQYLEAGATTVFVLGGRNRGISRSEVEALVDAFQGRLNVSLKLYTPDALTVRQLGHIGVSRISVGPALQFAAVDKLREVAEDILKGT